MTTLIEYCKKSDIVGFKNAIYFQDTKLPYNIENNINNYLYNFEKEIPICLLISVDEQNDELIDYILENYKKYINLFNYNSYDQLFEMCYSNDNIEMFDKLVIASDYTFDIHYDNEKYFRNACNVHGHIKWVKYLWNLSLKMNSPIDYNKKIILYDLIYQTPFINAMSFYGCEMNNGNNAWEVIKYLIKISDGKIKHDINNQDDLDTFDKKHQKYLRKKLNLQF